MNNARILETVKTKEHGKVTVVYIPDNYRDAGKLFDFLSDMTYPVINPIITIERAEIVGYIPQNGWKISLREGINVNNLIRHLNGI